MTTGPTDDEIHEVLAAVMRFETIASGPGVTPDQFAPYAEEAWRLSPPHALTAVASIGAARWMRVMASVRRNDSAAIVEFPREFLASEVPLPPVDDGSDLVDGCLVLVEEMTEDRFDRQQLLDLEGGDIWPFLVLHSIATVLGQMLIDVDLDRPRSLDKLVAEEALEQEFNWVHGIR